MSLLAIIVIIVLLAAFIYMWAKCQSLQKEVHLKENKENELKKLALVLQNINAYFLLIDKDFVVCDTNYYSLNHLPVQVGQYSCEKMSFSARKFLAAGLIAGFQIHPRKTQTANSVCGLERKKRAQRIRSLACKDSFRRGHF